MLSKKNLENNKMERMSHDLFEKVPSAQHYISS